MDRLVNTIYFIYLEIERCGSLQTRVEGSNLMVLCCKMFIKFGNFCRVNSPFDMDPFIEFNCSQYTCRQC